MGGAILRTVGREIRPFITEIAQIIRPVVVPALAAGLALSLLSLLPFASSNSLAQISDWIGRSIIWVIVAIFLLARSLEGNKSQALTHEQPINEEGPGPAFEFEDWVQDNFSELNLEVSHLFSSLVESYSDWDRHSMAEYLVQYKRGETPAECLNVLKERQCFSRSES